LENLLMVLAPFAPHITEELWYQIGHKSTIHIDNWPSWNDDLLKSDQTTIIIQVNGKVRARLECNRGLSKDEVETMAFANGHVMSFIEGKQNIKNVYIPDKILNIVVK
ncbi:MAG: class I tRNA ligase family protein, partial [Candidatus Saccharibacteria bacterium]